MSNLSIIDGDFIPYYICYNKKDSIPKTLEEIYQGIDGYIKYLLFITQVEYYIGFLSPKKTFRNDINKLYKAQRKSSDICFLKEVRVYLQDKYQFKEVENLEADDCCLILENQLKDKFNITVISPDQDVRFTLGNRYNPNKNEFTSISENEVEKKFYLDLVSGQSSDGIKGIPGSGIKAAERILNQSTTFKDNNYLHCVLEAYLEYFGEYKGIQEFYTNYMSLYILREYEGFSVGENDLIKVEISEFTKEINNQI